jgi:endonuclease/exonuclease/phosphatase family metal-dependent hydrolase
MASPFGKPRFQYDYDLDTERRAVDRFFRDPARNVPKKGKNETDLATWNIANLGAQKRRPRDLALIAHILSKFDIIAVQEVNQDLGHFREVLKHLAPKGFAAVFTDVAGNEERLAVVYRKARVRPRQLIGELDYNPNGTVVEGRYVLEPMPVRVRAGGKTRNLSFYNFSRNPYLTSWEVVGRKYTFTLASTHIYWGDPDPADAKSAAARTKRAKFDQRIAEVFYLANWASTNTQNKKKSALVYDANIILLGDMNIPTMNSDELVWKALLRKGLRPSRYATEMGTTLQEFTKYDQVVFTKEQAPIRLINGRQCTVVDFDNYVFADLWKDRGLADFKAWTKFAISDHRPLFVRLAP